MRRRDRRFVEDSQAIDAIARKIQSLQAAKRQSTMQSLLVRNTARQSKMQSVDCDPQIGDEMDDEMMDVACEALREIDDDKAEEMAAKIWLQGLEYGDGVNIMANAGFKQDLGEGGDFVVKTNWRDQSFHAYPTAIGDTIDHADNHCLLRTLIFLREVRENKPHSDAKQTLGLQFVELLKVPICMSCDVLRVCF